jgi:hypothetical protein
MLRSSPSHATYNLQHALEVLTEVSILIPYKAFAQTQSQCKFTREIKQAPQIGCSKSHENFLSKLLRSAVVIYIYTYCKNAQFVSAKNPGRDIFEWRAIFWLTFFWGFPAWLCGFYGFCGFCEGLWLLLYLALPIYLSI